MSEALMNRLVEFAESGNQQKIVCGSQSYQGWIMEITEEALMLSTGFADKSGKDLWFNLNELQQAELYYWDNRQDQWINFQL